MQHNAIAAGAHGMTEADRAAIDIQSGAVDWRGLAPLAADLLVGVLSVPSAGALPAAVVVVMFLASPATRAALAALRTAGCVCVGAAPLPRGGVMLGLCGGYQKEGHTLAGRFA